MMIQVKRTNRKSIGYSLAPEELTIFVPNDATEDDKLEKILSETTNHCHNEMITKERFNQILNDWMGKMQVKPKKVQLKKMKSKWASCSPGKAVTFNSLLTGMPEEFVGYVICHELLHFKVPNHNKLFKSLLSAYMPDWQERISNTIDFVLNQCK